jgi:hypothetical protein
MYNVNSYTVSIVANNRNSGIISSHADGQLVRYVIQERLFKRYHFQIIGKKYIFENPKVCFFKCGFYLGEIIRSL